MPPLNGGDHQHARSRIPDGWIRSVECSWQAKLVLFALASFRGTNATCWPSIPKLAKACCCSQNTVRKGLRELVNAGLVSKRKQGNRQFEYTIHKFGNVLNSPSQREGLREQQPFTDGP